MGCNDVFCQICGICVFIPKYDLDKKYTSKLILNDHYIDFGGVEKYWDQYFDWNKMIEDRNFWMGESPLKNAKNYQTIKNKTGQTCTNNISFEIKN